MIQCSLDTSTEAEWEGELGEYFRPWFQSLPEGLLCSSLRHPCTVRAESWFV
jgi:hypothetical protein